MFLKLLTTMFSETNSKSFFKKVCYQPFLILKQKTLELKSIKCKTPNILVGFVKKVSERIRLHVFVLYVNTGFILLNVTSLALQSIIY